jgi:hypothetical protein
MFIREKKISVSYLILLNTAVLIKLNSFNINHMYDLTLTLLTWRIW